MAQFKSNTKRGQGSAVCSCLVCGAVFRTYSCYVKDGRGKYCSSACGYKSMKKYPDGYKRCTACKTVKQTKNFGNNKHHHDNLASECKPCVKVANYARMTGKRNEFVRKLGSTCNICSVTNDNPSFFDIDHVSPLFKLGEKRIQYKFEDETNLQLLCPNCHRLKTLKDGGWA